MRHRGDRHTHTYSLVEYIYSLLHHPGAVDLSTGAAIRENALSTAGACGCQSAAAAAASTTTALAFYVGHISYWYDNSRAS